MSDSREIPSRRWGRMWVVTTPETRPRDQAGSRPELDPETCYRAIAGRDRRYDGVFYTAVATTGIYCRPSCPARTPARRNVTFHRSAAAAQSAGYRACKRCLPDATPGSPEWDVAADVAGRAMRLISDGIVDREGVEGLATRLGYSSRQVQRLLVAQLGAGPLALAQARRAQTARVLVERTDLRLADVAFAAGFASVRQFNETMRTIYQATPSELRGRSTAGQPAVAELGLRIAVRTPFAGAALRDFLARRMVAGVEQMTGDWYSRTLRLPHGPGVVRVRLVDLAAGQRGELEAAYRLSDLRDLTAAMERTRRLVDADADPAAVHGLLDADPVIGPLARAWPGLRTPGHVDGAEVAVRAVLGQQVTVGAAQGLASRLTSELGEVLPAALADDGLDRLFPSPAALAEVDPEQLPMPRARGRALAGLATALAESRIALDRGAEREETREALLALPGIGPWTADYISMRALGNPDVILLGDVGTRQAAEQLGLDRSDVSHAARAWAPWRSYAQQQLWQSLRPNPKET